jgi:hypothetical protein
MLAIAVYAKLFPESAFAAIEAKRIIGVSVR